jgi:hypothetical protein
VAYRLFSPPSPWSLVINHPFVRPMLQTTASTKADSLHSRLAASVADPGSGDWLCARGLPNELRRRGARRLVIVQVSPAPAVAERDSAGCSFERVMLPCPRSTPGGAFC